MSDELFEVAFSGQISDAASLDEVRQKVGKMFNADEAKLTQLFSGKRIVIKKNIDQATANKYKTALNRAGALCEIRSLSAGGDAPAASESDNVQAAETQSSNTASAASSIFEATGSGEVPLPPQTNPLGITPDQIEELTASIAPPGSELQEGIKHPEAPAIDISGIDIAPVGSDLGGDRKKPDPPPPDTTGITLAD